jgi:hypothetical protein
MKNPSQILIFSCIISGLLTSVTAGKKPGIGISYNTPPEIENDTAGYASLIKVDTFKLPILPPSSGVQFYRNGIVFLSLSKNEGKMLPDHVSFGAIEAYYAVPDDSVLGKHLVFSPGSSFSYPCESITFSQDFNTMYFTKLSEKDKKEKIYLARFTSNGKKLPGWQSEILPLDFCTNNSIYSHPSLSNDENILVFASDKKGYFGGMDLFISRKTGGKWSVPENLGNLINTKGNEFFPFLDSDNNLFFSSDGLGGFGGYDVYTCKFNGEDWDKPINLSYPVNSANDDFAFTINRAGGKTAFFTRGNNRGKGEMQLFRVTLKEVFDKNILTISNVFIGKSALNTGSTVEKSTASVNTVKEEPLELIMPADTVKVVPVAMNDNNDIVVYRVQILSSMASKGKCQITVFNKPYDTYEYYYKKAYRCTIGEFSSIARAIELRNICRSAGYPQAFVVAFKNNIRSFDPQLFK